MSIVQKVKDALIVWKDYPRIVVDKICSEGYSPDSLDRIGKVQTIGGTSMIGEALATGTVAYLATRRLWAAGLAATATLAGRYVQAFRQVKKYNDGLL